MSAGRRLRAIAAALALCALGAAPAPSKTAKPRNVTLKTADDWSLSAAYLAAGKPEAVILLHGLAASKEEWAPLSQALARRGISSLAIDLRGHGRAMENGRPRSFQTFADHGPEGEWARMWKDAEAGYRFLRPRGYRRIGIAGASVGANVALWAAAEIPQLDFAALLSPGIDYQGIRTPEALQGLGSRRLLFAVSASDPYAYQSAAALRQMRTAAGLPAEWIEAQSGHGAQMFQEPEILERITAWIAEPPKP